MSLPSQIMQDSPSFYWPLNESSGTTALDVSGNARNGTYNGSPTLNQPGPAGLVSVTFDAVDDFISSSYAGMSTSAVTLDCWTKPDTQVDAAATLVGRQSYYATAVTDFPIRIGVTSAGQFNALFDSGNDFSQDTTLLDPTTATVGRWYYVAATFTQNGTSYLYVNGVAVASATTNYALAAGSRNWSVGRASFENGGGVGDSSYKGSIAHVAVFASALSADRIMSHYKAGIRSGVGY